MSWKYLNDREADGEYSKYGVGELKRLVHSDPSPIQIGEYNKKGRDGENGGEDHQSTMNSKPSLDPTNQLIAIEELEISKQQLFAIEEKLSD